MFLQITAAEFGALKSAFIVPFLVLLGALCWLDAPLAQAAPTDPTTSTSVTDYLDAIDRVEAAHSAYATELSDLYMGLGRGNIGGGGFGRKGQQGMYDVVLRLRQLLAGACGDETIHLLLGDLDSLVDVTALHPLDDHFPAHLLAHCAIGLPLLFQRLAELIQVHTVLGSDAHNGVVELGIGNAYAYPGAHLQLDIFQDQPVQGFPDNFLFRW